MPSVNTKLNDRLTKDAVLARVPAFSPSILRVLDLLSKPEESASSLAQAVGMDPGLSAQVLRLANSALFGAQARIDTVQKAVLAVGNSWLQHLTLTLGVTRYMSAAGQSPELQRCWRHMLACAILSRELSRAAVLPADRAYTAGLLHDIGRLGLLAAFPAQYVQALHDSARENVPLLEVERKTFGTDHADLGRCLVENWNLPAEFGPVVGRHHDELDKSALGLQAVVQAACRLADTLGFFFTPPSSAMTIEEVRELMPPVARDRFPSDAAQLTKMVEEAMQESDLGPAEPPPSIPAPESASEEPDVEEAAVEEPQAESKQGWMKTALRWFR